MGCLDETKWEVLLRGVRLKNSRGMLELENISRLVDYNIIKEKIDSMEYELRFEKTKNYPELIDVYYRKKPVDLRRYALFIS